MTDKKKKFSELSRGEVLDRFFSDYTSADYKALKEKEKEMRQAKAGQVEAKAKPQPLALEEYHAEKEHNMSYDDMINQAIRLANKGKKGGR